MATVYAAKCQGCDFEQRIFGCSDYAYRLAEAPDVFLYTQFAWCSHCQQIIQAERLLSLAEIEDYIARTSNRRIRQDAERYRQMMTSRQSAARCLKCGGIDIIPASGSWSERTIPHPACGSKIILHHAGHARVSPNTDVYSPEGEYLTTVEGGLMPGRGYEIS